MSEYIPHVSNDRVEFLIIRTTAEKKKRQRSIIDAKCEKLAVGVHVFQNTQNLAISPCCFAEDGYEMYKDL